MKIILFSLFISFNTVAKDKVIGGSFANKNQFKNVVAILAKTWKGTALCTGTIIHPRIVLTAAHCTLNRSVIRVGQAGVSIKVKAFKDHELYKEGNNDAENAKNDIAVLVLEKPYPINTSDIVPLITTAQSRKVKFKNKKTKFTIVGFGKTGVRGTSGTKKYKTITYKKDLLVCPKFDSSEVINMVEGSYFGDSGGPAFTTVKGKNVQIGVATTVTRADLNLGKFKVGDCNRSQYVNLSRHLNWLKENFDYPTSKNTNEYNEYLMKKYGL